MTTVTLTPSQDYVERFYKSLTPTPTITPTPVPTDNTLNKITNGIDFSFVLDGIKEAFLNMFHSIPFPHIPQSVWWFLLAFIVVLIVSFIYWNFIR